MKAESKAIIFGRYNQIYHKDFNSHLELKPLSSISDEDKKLLGIDGIHHFDIDLFNDELRQLGYATPQTVIEDGKAVNYSVEELVNEGVFKLVEYCKYCKVIIDNSKLKREYGFGYDQSCCQICNHPIYDNLHGNTLN